MAAAWRKCTSGPLKLARLVFPSTWSWDTIEAAVRISFPDTSVELRGPKKHEYNGTRMIKFDVVSQDIATVNDTLSHLSLSLSLPSPSPSPRPQRCSPSPSPVPSLSLPRLDCPADLVTTCWDVNGVDKGTSEDEEEAEPSHTATDASAESSDGPPCALPPTVRAPPEETDPHEDDGYASPTSSATYASAEEGEEEPSTTHAGRDEEEEGSSPTATDASARSSSCHWCHYCRYGSPCASHTQEDPYEDDGHTSSSTSAANASGDESEEEPSPAEDSYEEKGYASSTTNAEYARESEREEEEEEDEEAGEEEEEGLEDGYRILWSRQECISKLRNLVLPQDFPFHAIENLCSLAEIHYFVDMYEDIAEYEDMMIDYALDMKMMLATKARAIRLATHYERPLRAIIADMKAEDGFSLALPTDPCVLAALGEMRKTLEKDTAFCVAELSVIASQGYKKFEQFLDQ